jgi:gamma-glutamyltranspeptidase/glutathione hydrolase
MVCTSSPLAAKAAIDVLKAGGTAADAAVAAAAVLSVVDPHATGIGGDAFALWWGPDDPHPRGVAGAGPAPAGTTVDALRAAGYESMPQTGPWTVTVPGAVSVWERLLEACGRLEPTRVLGAAIDLARQGFPVGPAVARSWSQDGGRLSLEARRRYMPGGAAPNPGERFANPALSDTLARIADGGADAFYQGEVAARIAGVIQAEGGPLRVEDLHGFAGAEWVDPLAIRYRGIDIYEMPPPGQGMVVLEALGLFEAMEPHDQVSDMHELIECTKLAVADGSAYIGDPKWVDVPSVELLSESYLSARRAELDLASAREAVAGIPSDTVYVAVADADGGACSLIQSLYEGFGSGYEAPGTGILLHNRGANFTLEAGHPNSPAPGKRPFHTIIPAMFGAGDRFVGCLGVVGGFMQPQGQLQLLRNLLDLGMTPQAAIDAPRWRVQGGLKVDVEESFDPSVTAALRRRGHRLGQLDARSAGAAQLVLRDASGFMGASDRRRDRGAQGRFD